MTRAYASVPETPVPAAPALRIPSNSLVQRKCKCHGGSTSSPGLDDLCPTCRAASLGSSGGYAGGKVDGPLDPNIIPFLGGDPEPPDSEPPASESELQEPDSTQQQDASESEPQSPSAPAPAGEGASSLIADDDAETFAPGQMRKSEFLSQLRVSVCAAADSAMAATGQNTEGCPYIEDWFAYYADKSASHVERALRRYAPDAVNVQTAAGYIPVFSNRVSTAVSKWATTGEIDAPDELRDRVPAAAGAPVQAKAREGGRRPGSARAIRSQLQGRGAPLDGAVRTRMESAFGHDFSRVRVHSDSNAASLSDSLNARAFTVGGDIGFASGEYQPGSPVGDALLAHELAHVVQQSGGEASEGPHAMDGGAYDALEQDADQSATGALASLWGGAKSGLADLAKSAIPRMRSGLRLSRCKSSPKPQALNKKTDTGGDPTGLDCGGYKWAIQWYLNNPADKGGWIVQQVDTTWDVKDCAGNPVSRAGTFYDTSNYPYWEAWEIHKDQSATTYAEGGDTKDDTYWWESGPGDNTKGTMTFGGTADYYDGLTLPKTFTVTNASPAYILPYTKTDPKLTGGVGSIPHLLKIQWDCCPGSTDKKSKLTPT